MPSGNSFGIHKHRKGLGTIHWRNKITIIAIACHFVNISEIDGDCSQFVAIPRHWLLFIAIYELKLVSSQSTKSQISTFNLVTMFRLEKRLKYNCAMNTVEMVVDLVNIAPKVSSWEKPHNWHLLLMPGLLVVSIRVPIFCFPDDVYFFRSWRVWWRSNHNM